MRLVASGQSIFSRSTIKSDYLLRWRSLSDREARLRQRVLRSISDLSIFQMSRKDTFHDAVRHALEKDGWIITHDPLILRYELGNLYIDLGAEKVFAAEREGEKIAVEVKGFLKNSAVNEFHTALGQFISYRVLLAEQYPEYVLHLAVPMDAYTSFFATQLAQGIIHSQQLKLIIYKPQQEAIEQWLT
jgi:hypothetical protein